MLYDTIKILHIISATFLLISLIYTARLWLRLKSIEHLDLIDKIQIQAWRFFTPLAIFQLGTGFTMISLKQYNLSDLWIVGSISGFILLILCWFGFLYTLLCTEVDHNIRKKRQTLLMGLSGTTILIMIFLMANKIP